MLFSQIPLPGTDLPVDSIPDARQELAALKSLSFDEFIDKIIKLTVDFAISLAIAILVFYVGKYIIRKLYQLTATVLLRRNVDKSLSTFILSLVRIVLYFILIVTVIGILGINTTSFIAIFASAGVAIGMALSGTLQNFAGGVLILLLKPYKIGDYIEAQGYSGTVTEIQIFHTIICTADNKSIIIPNGGLSTGSVINWSREEYRRVEWNIGISYGDDVAKAREVILGLINADSRVVKKFIEDDREERLEAEREAAVENHTAPEEEKRHSWLYRLFHRSTSRVKAKIETIEEAREAKLRAFIPKVDRTPVVNLGSLGDSSINLVVRAWTRSEYYWSVFFSLNEQIYNELPRHGLSFPFPQMDVHMIPSSDPS